MVEINNQRKAFLDMLAWSEGTDNGRQETQKSWLWRHCRRRLFTDYSNSPSQTCHAKPKLKSTGAGRCKTFRVGGMPYRKRLAWKDFSPKSRVTACSRLRAWRFTYDWSWWYPSGNRPLQQISGLHCRALVMVSSSIRLTAWLQNSKKRAEPVRLMYGQVTRYLRSGYLHHRLPVMGC